MKVTLLPEEYADEKSYRRQVEDESEHINEGGWTPVREMQTDELTRHMLSSDDVIEQLEHQLRGEDFDYEKNMWLKAVGKPVLNERGVRIIISRVRWYVNRVPFLSNLEDPQIYEMMYNFSNNLTELIFNNGDEWELNWAYAMQNNLVDEICDLVFIGLRRAFAQGERKFLGSHTKILHRIDESPNQKQAGKKWGIF